MNIYVGNLSFSVNDTDLKETFGAYGAVQSASVIKDKFSGESRGFGFIEMPTDAEAMAAMEKLNGSDFGGRKLTINEARPMEPRSGGGDRGGRGGDRGGRGGYGGNKW